MKLNLELQESSAELQMQLAETQTEMDVDLDEIQTVTEYVRGEPYEGDYFITPKVDSQTMPTKGKVMVEDVTVNAIPFFEVSNNSGGNTVYIAKEI